MAATTPPQLQHLRTLTLASLQTASILLTQLTQHQESLTSIADMAGAIAHCFSRGDKVLICGNGGSLCDAAHFAEELTGRFRADRRPLPAIAIADAGHITCTANDYGYDHVFARGVTALGRPGDCLIVLSTSGNSANCVLALEAGREAGLTLITLLGKGGGKLRGLADHQLIVPGETSDRVQELHMLVLHILVELIESQLK